MKKLPDGWRIVELKDIFNIKKGKKVNVIENHNSDAIPYIGIENLRGVTISQYTFDKTGLLCEKEDILLVWDGANCGTVGSDLSGYVGSTIARLRLVNQLANKDYVLRFLKSKFEYFNSHTTGATIPHLDKKIVLSLKIPLPPPPTQKKIAAILEKAEKLREWRKEADELTDELLKSTFLEMFGDPLENPKGWKEGYLGDLFSDVRYGISLKSGSEGYPIIGMNSITYEGRIDWSNLSKVKITSDIFHKERLKKYDLLFNRTNAFDLVGKTGIVDKEIDAVAASYLIRLRINPSYEPYFVWGLMNSPYFKALFSQRCKKAVNQANINSKELAAFPAIFPPHSLQQKFAKLVEQVEQIREHQKQSRQHIEKLFSALMQRAFLGELEV